MQIPEDLGTLTDEQLHELDDEIRAEAARLADEDRNDDTVQALERLAATHRNITNELGNRAEANQEREERVAAALREFDGADPAADGDAAQPAAETEPVPEPAAAAVTPAPVPAPAVPALTLNQPAATTATATVQALTAGRPNQFAPVTGSDHETGPNARRHGLAQFVDQGVMRDSDKGKKLTPTGLAERVIEQHRKFSKVSGNIGPVTLATAQTTFAPENTVNNADYQRNFAVLQAAAQEQAIDRSTDEAVVASGALCAPFTPYYDIFHLAEPMSPVENSLPTVGAPRGGIRYVQTPTWTQAQAGVRFTTAAQNAAGYQGHGGTTPVKPCVHLACTNVLECVVDAVSACVAIDNLQSMTFNELVEVFLLDLAVAQAQAKEMYYLDVIEAGSTKVTFTPSYGATRGLSFSIGLAAYAYRKRNHMALDAPITWLAPDTLVPFLAADMVNDFANGLNYLNIDAQQVATELFRKYRVNVSFYYDFSTSYGSRAAMQHPQLPGALNKWTTNFRNYFFAPGTWVRLDGGTLDVGVVRDTTTNATNDFQIFAEEWTQLCKRGVESVQLDLTLCPSGVGPVGGTALACAS